MITTLAPLITREIFYRLLHGQHGPMLRQSFADSGRTAQIADAIRWIRSHFDEPYSSETLAATVHMSVPSLNRHFRAVTAMSPLQYQKHVRMQEARQPLLHRGVLVRGAVVGDQMQRLVPGRLAIDLEQELQPRDMPYGAAPVTARVGQLRRRGERNVAAQP